jgi:hypothetical protein
MTLKELKKMIAEEYAAFKSKSRKRINEQPVDMPDLPGMPGISVSDNDVDATGGAGDAEAALKEIQKMIEDYFSADEEDDAADDADDDAGAEDAEDAEGEEDEEADLEEISNHGMGKSAKKTSGKNAGYKTVKESKRVFIPKAKKSKAKNLRKFTSNKPTAILEQKIFKSRLQKLANIKK